MDLNQVLIEAAKDGNMLVLKTALEKGADINAADSLGMTALMYADKNGHNQVADYLKEKGAENKGSYTILSGVFLIRGITNIDLGEYQEAINDFNSALELGGEKADVYSNRGHAYAGLGQYQEAFNDYAKAIELDSENATTYYFRGNAYFELGQYQKSIEDYTRAIELNPEYAVAFYNRGVAFSKLGKYQEAFEDYTRAIELNPEDADAYYFRGVAYVNFHQYQDAIDDCYQAGRLYIEKEDKTNAQRCIDTIKIIDPHSSLILKLQDLIDQI